ncbi:MAG: methyltransferase family protein [Thermoanaerobaculia bacterium]
MALRHLASFLALPFVAAVVVPLLLARRAQATVAWPDGTSSAVVTIVGLVVFAAGLVLFGASVYEFVTRGRGTLAPWDPPRELVVHGPYRYVRNPMISGVLLLLIAEAILLRSAAHGTWAALFVLINAVYIPLSEEPNLERRFGSAYREYCRHVPRLVPRLSPWKGTASNPESAR